jgi:hypothetical protein
MRIRGGGRERRARPLAARALLVRTEGDVMHNKHLGLAALLTFVGACGVSEEELEDLETAQGALGASFTTFTLPAEPDSQFQLFEYGPDKNAYACFITRMSGPHVDNNARSWANLIRDPGGPNWYLRTDGDTSVTATCVQTSWFQATGTARWQRTTGEGNYDESDGLASASGTPSNIGTDQANIWWANAASHVTGLYGYLQHPYDNVAIQEGASGTTPSRVTVMAASNFIEGYSGSVFVGTPGTSLKAAYVGPTYQINHTGSSWSTTYMAKTSEAVCFFTQIGGRLAGPDDVLKINTKVLNGVERWALEAKAGSGGEIRIKARCMARQQPS